MEITKPDYFGVNVTKIDAFYIVTNPRLSSLQVFSEDGLTVGGWGENWRYRSTVQDLDADNLNVTLYVNLTGPWDLRNSTTCSGSTCVSPTTIELNSTGFVCENLGLKNFNFTVTDIWNFTNSSTSTFTFEADDVTIEPISGFGPTINRSGTQNASFLLRVLDSIGKFLV